MAGNILILEDDPSLLRLYSKVLERVGYRVTAVSTLEAARQHLIDGGYQVFLCDLHVGGDTSFALLHDLRDWMAAQGTQVLIITANDHYRTIVAETFGLESYLAKPITNQMLVALVDRQTGLKRQTQEICALVQ
jgi:two-component system response regulator GlrR